MNIFNVTHSITIMTDGCTNFRKFLIDGAKPSLKKIKEYVDRSLMLVPPSRRSLATTRPRRLRTTQWTTISP
jgi:fumarate hydratase class II